MSLSDFLRASGLSAMIGGLLFITIPIWFLGVSEKIGTYVDHFGTILISWGLFGLYLSQMKTTGRLGFISFVIAFFGTSLWIGFKWMSTFVMPDIAIISPDLLNSGPPENIARGLMISLPFFLIGWILLAAVTAWKAVLPRWGAILVIFGLVSDVIPYLGYIAQPVAGIGIVWLGWALWNGKKEAETIK